MQQHEFDDHYWMQLAYEQAALAASKGEVPVGAVIVSNNQVIGVGHNQPIFKHDPTAHAEILAIKYAAPTPNKLPIKLPKSNEISKINHSPQYYYIKESNL